jgi:hypothetical protein
MDYCILNFWYKFKKYKINPPFWWVSLSTTIFFRIFKHKKNK